MTRSQPAHLFVDISAHGFGHLAQVAPVLNAVRELAAPLRLTVRSALPHAGLKARLTGDFVHLREASDFGYVMRDAVTLDLAATGQAYRAQHADWDERVEREAKLLTSLQVDLLLSNVSYLPLAGAARAAIPALSMCSLNWAELFAHFFAAESWGPALHRQMLAAYRSAEFFLRLTPAMAMSDLPKVRDIAPLASIGRDCREQIAAQLGIAPGERLVLVAFGGVGKRLPIADWPRLAGVRWLVPADWDVESSHIVALESLERPFIDLLRSVDAVITKPGYGTFTEAACNATPVLYLPRPDWPEQDCLIDWLSRHGRCRAVSDAELTSGRLQGPLAALWEQPAPPPPQPTGAAEAAAALLPWLNGSGR